MLDFNSCYAYLRSSNASEEQGLWLQLLLSAPAVGYRRVAVQPPESAAHNRYLNRWMAHDSTRQPKVRGRNWVIHVSSPCFVHEKIWLPPPHLYIYILQVCSANQKTSWICLKFIPMASPKLPKKSGMTHLQHGDLLLLGWMGPGVNRRNLWEFKKMSLLYTGIHP